MTSPGGFVSIIISASARTGAAFARIRADLARMTATVRLSVRRWTSSVIARGGLGAVIAQNLRTAMGHVRSFASRFPASIRSAVSRAVAHMARFGASALRVTGQMARLAGQVGSTLAPFALMAGKVVAVAAAVAALSGVMGNMIGIVQLAAPAAIAGGAAMAVFKMALSGVSEAMQAGIEGDTEKLAEALKKLSPAARSAVLTLLDLRKEWVHTQKAVQERFFVGFRDDVIAVSRAIQPVADRWLPKMADAFAAARMALRQVFVESAQSGQLDKIMGGVTQFFQNLVMAVQPFAKAFLQIAEVAAPKFAKLGEVIANLAKSFRDWIDGAKESGKLTGWLDKAWETFGKLWEVVKNLGSAMAGIFRASSGGGDSFLDNLVNWTQSLSDWVNSGDGQAMISILSEVISALSQSAPVFSMFLDYLKVLVVWWGILWEGAKAAWDGIVAAAKFAIMMIIGWFDLLLQGAAKAFGWIPGIGDKLKGAAKDFNDFKNRVNESINGIQKTVDITVNYRARMIGDHLVSASQQSGSYSSGIGGRAHGGNASGVIMAGERGPELIDVGSSAHVNNAGATRQMMARGTSNGPLVISVEAPQAGANSYLAQMFLSLLHSGAIRLKAGPGNRVVPA
jgi:hypothetical protein